jgi:hypothetical protein
MNRIVLLFLMAFAFHLAAWIKAPPGRRGEWIPLLGAGLMAFMAILFFGR